jgi:orotidine-5'-phosphate decarboxylase
MWQRLGDARITDVCMPRGIRPGIRPGIIPGIRPAAAQQRRTRGRQHLAYTGRALTHEGGPVGDAAMLKNPIATPALCVALGLRPDMGERNAC